MRDEAARRCSKRDAVISVESGNDAMFAALRQIREKDASLAQATWMDVKDCRKSTELAEAAVEGEKVEVVNQEGAAAIRVVPSATKTVSWEIKFQ
mgnify:CR=1 FL=1